MSQLDRRRLNRNFLDVQDGDGQRLGSQERSTSTTDGRGRTHSTGLLVAVLSGPPEPPAVGYVLLYAESVGGDVYLRAMDAGGTVIELGDWA